MSAVGDLPAGLRIRQHCSLFAWLRTQQCSRVRSRKRLQRPAIAWDAASEARLPDGRSAHLPWVSFEAACSDSIWTRGCQPPYLVSATHQAHLAWPPKVSANETVNALIGIGHGGAPDGNWAHSGLWMPTWRAAAKARALHEEPFLSAQVLSGIAHVERLFMSCCVLGRVEDQLGEPLGIVSLAFAYRTRVAIGSLLPVDDASAMLISLALQWRLAHAGAEVDWIDQFQALRCDLWRGQWPAGFAPWLLRKVARSSRAERRSARALIRAPRQLAPACDWFVAFG